MRDLILEQIDKKPHQDEVPNEIGVSVSRRPSKRQQEKAPEGRPPHMPTEHEGGEATMNETPSGVGPAPAESRFTEGV